jgi:palmitoyltransferase
MRKIEKYKILWNLNCYNFKNRSIRDNICRFCVTLKPERAYHCKQCRRCFKKMDHHCLFLNNCVGFNNYKIFLNMLMYTCLVIAFTVIIMIESSKFIINEYSVIFIFILVLCFHCILFVFAYK